MNDSPDTASTADSSGDATRITIRLSADARAAISEIQRLAHMDTIQEVIKRAISDELFLLRERAQGARVLLQKGTRYREVTWPDYR